LLDLHEHAAKKIKAEQKVNRDKSMAKIKELTEMHKKTKLTKEEVKSRLEEELPSDEEKGAKTTAKDKKFVNKNTVA
jgi:hypothetical protein